MRIACWIPKATDTHSEYVILIVFPMQQWLHEHCLSCFPLTKMCTSPHAPSRKRQKTIKSQVTPELLELLHVTLLVPRILVWVLHFLEILWTDPWLCMRRFQHAGCDIQQLIWPSHTAPDGPAPRPFYLWGRIRGSNAVRDTRSVCPLTFKNRVSYM
jgi:hypothetical protein